MNQYKKGNTIITATEKAYNVVYKGQGFVPYEEAEVFYNRLGSEAESSRNEGGVSVTYSTDIPENLKRRLKSYRLLKVVKCNENKE